MLPEQTMPQEAGNCLSVEVLIHPAANMLLLTDTAKIEEAITIYLTAHHPTVTRHTEITLLTHLSELEMSTQMIASLMVGDLNLSKSELLVSSFLKKMYIGDGSNRDDEDVFRLSDTKLDIIMYECIDKRLIDEFDDISLSSNLHEFDYITAGLNDDTLQSISMTALPNTKFDNLWSSLQFSAQFKSQLLGHARLSLALSEYPELNNMNNKILVLHGPPGCGKTTVCKALAHKISIQKKGILIELSGGKVFSKWFGESSKKLEIIFRDLYSLIESNPELMFCVLIDEVETLASSRSQTLDKNEATDSVRVVNTLLTQLDSLKSFPNFIIIGTSNLVSSLDEAFLDRADEVFEINQPDVGATYNILRQSINKLISCGVLEGDTLLSDFSAFKEECDLYDFSKKCHSLGKSGRGLIRLPLMVCAKRQITSGKIAPVSVSCFIQWLNDIE
jgi:hypothetical protein